MPQISNWKKLDNAGKIFPPTSNDKETWVFRIACQLSEQVDREKLQIALEKTIRQFPIYTSVLRKGVFWYYFEETSMQPKVKEEYKAPCAPLYHAGQRNLLFEVTYNQNRINFEVYHALTDGTGAIQFMRTLVYYYLLEAHKNIMKDGIELKDYNATTDEKEQDGFSKYYTTQKGDSLPKQVKAYQLKGDCFFNNQMGVIEGKLSVEQLIRLAKKYNSTISEFLTTILILAIHDGMSIRDASKPVVIVVPVNLRNFFPSATARNFFSVANISHSFSEQGDSFEDVLNNVKAKYKELISKEKMRDRLNTLYAIEDKIFARLVPVSIKDIGLKVAEWLSGKENTASFSNIGKITMPSEMKPYIKGFDFFTSTKHMQVCVCSFVDSMTISFTSRIKSTTVQSGFFRRLAALGLDIEISSNTVAQNNSLGVK